MSVKILGSLDVSGSMNITSSDVPNLDAAKITSGTLGTARIPSLAASKITSGTFGSARIPTELTQGVTKVGSTTDYVAVNVGSGNTIAFFIDGTEVARLTSAGDLHVKGDVIAYSDSL